MSKRALKKYVSELKKKDLETQLLELYDRFPGVKAYYDFIFNPKEDQLLQEAKGKISNEYFPLKRKRPKARRSVAQKYIKHFISLGVAPYLVADLMLYNIEVAQKYAVNKNLPDAFHKSLLTSFTAALQFISINVLLADYKSRILKCYQHTQDQEWPNKEAFSRALDHID
jgi:hypothetical protein